MHITLINLVLQEKVVAAFWRQIIYVSIAVKVKMKCVSVIGRTNP